MRHRRSAVLIGSTVAAVVAGGLIAGPALASSVMSATFSGTAGTVVVSGTLYAKQGAALTLSVVTSSDTQCVEVTGAMTAKQSTTAPKSSWTFVTSAPSGNGLQAVTVAASPNVNPQGDCVGQTRTLPASYVLDNTGPAVTGVATPAPNPSGWNTSNVSIAWSATDTGGSGVASGPTPASDSQSADTTGTTKTATATDALGNVGTGSVTIRLDKTAPSITGSRSPLANANGWNNSDVTVTFSCTDATSGIVAANCSGPTTLTANAANQSVTGTAKDNAGNTSTTTVSGVNIDKVAPTLSGSPTTAPNAAGWYKGDVTVHWTAADAVSGVAGSGPADSTILGEGPALTASASVSDRAGNSTTATSPAVTIDRTAPTTSVTAPGGWNSSPATASLSAIDALSGVEATFYSLDGAPAQSGTSVSIATEGDHTLQYWSVDKAGNAEVAKTVHVKVDTSAPTITHTQSPLANAQNWNKGDVTVTFDCADTVSGVATCSSPQTLTSEGAAQSVVGTATDQAGNSATDTAMVNIDKTPPVVSGARDREPNAAGWYQADVTVSFTCSDALSGVATCPAPKTLGEGAAQTASGTGSDLAGNSATATVSGVNIDKTAPELTHSDTSGWHTGDLPVDWSCTDALSRVAVGPADDTVTGEGDNLSSSATCVDTAGNQTSTTVSGIKIDRHAPITQASVPAPLASGWYAGPVTVTLTAQDALSGVAHTAYSVDGGASQTYSGPFAFTAKGIHTISFWSTDVAGNVEDKTLNVITVKIDDIAPTTTIINPISPASGWFVVSGIPFAFSAIDAESGVAATYYTIDGGPTQTYGQPFTEDLSTGFHLATVWSVDIAGNVEVAQTFPVNVDTAAPTISGKANPPANVFGWNNTPVDVTFQCADVGSGLQSGVAGCSGDTTLVNEGSGHSVHGTALDVAGNSAGADVGPVNIDTTKPTLTGLPTAPNAAGWHKTDVTVSWVGDDALSGLDPATQPAPSVITGEGANLGAGPVTIDDKAGNTSNPASVSGIKIDRTAPVIAGQATTAPNSAGWYSGDVVVDFMCTDALSGVASCPTSKLLKGDGANQSVTSDPATDYAGNASAGRTVSGINIDGTPPSSTSNNTCTSTNGWCTGTTADVILGATDQPGLSGVKEIRFVVNGGAEQVAPGASKTVTIPLSGSGAGTVQYWAVDNAGNAEAKNTVALKWDNIAPTVSHTLTPAPNADEWNNSDVTITFTAKDDDAGSGVATVSAPVTVSTETAGQVVTGTAKDTAGNTGTDSVTVKLDKSAPTITATITAGTLGSNGWYVGPVTVSFTCGDARSGIATCADPVILTSNGSANSATGTATDKAGNTASASLTGIKIDQEKPALTTADVNVQGGAYTVGSVPTATCTATDSVSGVASCTVTVAGGNANGVGAFTYTAKATDKAGNVTTITGTFKVAYRFDGFLQPINDTAHQVGTTTSVFKAGSTVPAKFQVKKADGTVVQAVSASWLTPVKGSSMSAPVDETVYTAPADSGSTYRYDASAQQYIYNWKTGAGGNYWRIGVTFDDGQTYFVNIGLR